MSVWSGIKNKLGLGRRTQLQLTATRYGKLSLVSNALGTNQSQAVEDLCDMFLESRYPGHREQVQQVKQEKQREREIQDLDLTGNSMIDGFLLETVEQYKPAIKSWIGRQLAPGSGATAKKKQFAGAMKDYLEEQGIIEMGGLPDAT